MPETLHRGKYLELKREGAWEYVSRCNNTGVVVVVAVTAANELLLVEQYRPPVGARVLELPAGLAGDHIGTEEEPMVEAAKRELVEETGYAAAAWSDLGLSPVSAGMTDEAVHFFCATGLTRVAEGGGDASEDIEVHRVPMAEVRAFLDAKRAAGVQIDAKIGGGLWMAAVQLGA